MKFRGEIQGGGGGKQKKNETEFRVSFCVSSVGVHAFCSGESIVSLLLFVCVFLVLLSLLSLYGKRE